ICKNPMDSALALEKVELSHRLNNFPSQLSGGEQQRVAIARALAKNPKLLLCDEPTGNLDSKSSAEIIELLREVSKDKLVIIVTHNFEQVEDYATRHIRIYDGAVETDHKLRSADPVANEPLAPAAALPPSKQVKHTLRNGLQLGRVRFFATPKLSVFLCILMVLTAMILTVITSLTYESRDLFNDPTMFTHVNGRTVIVRRDGAAITDEELADLAEKVGAQDYLHYDNMLDERVPISIGDGNDWKTYRFSFGYPAKSVTLDAGRYPERDNEVIVEVPVSAKPFMGEKGFEEWDLNLYMANFRVVGVSYYYDNTRTPRLLFTDRGYSIASAAVFMSRGINGRSFEYSIWLYEKNNPEIRQNLGTVSDTYVDFDLEEGSYFINLSELTYAKNNYFPGVKPEDIGIQATLTGSFNSYQYDYYYDYGYARGVDMEVMPSYGEEGTVSYSLESYRHADTMTEGMKQYLKNLSYDYQWNDQENCFPMMKAVILSPDILLDFLHENYYAEAYTQASLFFANDKEAHDKVEILRDLGYTAVVSDETVEPDVYTLILTKLSAGFMAFLWLLAIFFATLFLSLCSSRAMNATRGDVGIMRSMGIPAKVIKMSIYVQTLISLIPAVVVTVVGCAALYIIPKTNDLFPFLHVGDYAFLAVILLLIALNLSRKYAKKMFNQSVKKTLRTEKGGSKS
ncbi:MAG: ATP-binding cassette domain-containing protein, partial [Clostridia bacterium]|nr:ATP-binding cassette domain-containing protein [Clostridia bacterium]